MRAHRRWRGGIAEERAERERIQQEELEASQRNFEYMKQLRLRRGGKNKRAIASLYNLPYTDIFVYTYIY